jgi:hypothetical protein
MLNNKGSEPILALPTFYSLGGSRLQLEPITVGAASYLDIELSHLLAQAGEEFRQGSVNISYQGGNQQLGAQVKMVDAEKELIWAEQFVYGSKFVSSRLETVWWLPFDETKTRVVVSNTSGGTVTATIAVVGTAPEQSAPAKIMLAPWETRVLDIMTDLVGHGHGLVKFKGGISIVHTGSPGALLARMLIAAPERGYSAAASFIDPEMTASQRWHGNGLRLRNLDGTTLEPVLAVRNTSEQLSQIQGRIIYTSPDGSTSTINFQQGHIAPGATRVFNVSTLIKNANIPNAVTYGGIELEYDTPKGTILTSLQSVSRNGDHVFQVPMFDPQNMPSSAGGFPWKADGDYTTIVYIKNETAVARKFVSHLVYGSGQYSLGIRELKPGETMAIDFREFRDNQSPDSQGNLIPLDVDKGQIAWSVLGAEDKVLSGRSEQVSLTDGVASTYACANCCPNVIYEVFVDPFSLTTEVGLINQFTTTQTEQNCYGTLLGPYQGYANEWNSFNPGVATIDFTGNSEAVGLGDTNIEGCVERTIWYNWGGGYCEPFTDLLCDEAPVEVQCLLPTGETSNSGGWDPNAPTIHIWNQTLTGSGNFVGRDIAENDGTGGSDNCHWPDSEIPKAALTGLSATVTTGNKWGPDHVGYTPTSINYYRANGRAPCQAIVPQDMYISCPDMLHKYTSGNLVYGITATQISVKRHSAATQTKTWP